MDKDKLVWGTESELTCPECGNVSVESMPTDACVFYFECAQCGAVLKPKPGDCCVFCSWGSVPCPPFQQAKSCWPPGRTIPPMSLDTGKISSA